MIYSYCHLTGGLQSLPQGDPHPCEYQPNEKCMFEHNSLIVNQWAVPTITNLQSKCMFGRYHRLTLPLSDHRRGRVEFASSHSPKLVEHACCILILYYLLPQNSELPNIKMVLNQTTKVSFPMITCFSLLVISRGDSYSWDVQTLVKFSEPSSDSVSPRVMHAQNRDHPAEYKWKISSRELPNLNQLSIYRNLTRVYWHL